MRLIRFRAWIKDKKKMARVSNIDFINNEVICNYNAFEESDMIACYNSCGLSLGDVILMQYTGLKDKNGQEIYEGDLVKLYFGCAEMDIKETTSIAKVVYCKKGYGSEIGFTGIYPGGIAVALPCESAMEVIGNIFEDLEVFKE